MPLFSQMGERMVRWQEFEALMEPYLSTHTAMEIVMTAQALRLPFAFVPTVADLLKDEHLTARDVLREGETRRRVTIPGQPYKMSETPPKAAAPPKRAARTKRCWPASWATRRTT